MIENFRQLLHKRLGDLAVAVFDLRIEGGETKSLVGSPSLGFPSPYLIKRIVQEIKTLARQYAASLGDFTLLRRIDQAMQDEAGTAEKRKATDTAASASRGVRECRLPELDTSRQSTTLPAQRFVAAAIFCEAAFADVFSPAKNMAEQRITNFVTSTSSD